MNQKTLQAVRTVVKKFANSNPDKLGSAIMDAVGTAGDSAKFIEISATITIRIGTENGVEEIQCDGLLSP